MVEHLVYTEGVGGSSPSSPNTFKTKETLPPTLPLWRASNVGQLSQVRTASENEYCVWPCARHWEY